MPAVTTGSQSEDVGDVRPDLDDQAREHHRDHADQLDEDVQGGTRGVLERIADGVADDARLVGIRALATELAGLDVLLGVVPGTTGVRHEDRHREAADERSREEPHHAGHAEHEPDEDRDRDGHERGKDHLLLGARGRDRDARGVVRVLLAVDVDAVGPLQGVGDVLVGHAVLLEGALHDAELATALVDHRERRPADRVHRHRTEDEDEHHADEQAGEDLRVHQGHVVVGEQLRDRRLLGGDDLEGIRAAFLLHDVEVVAERTGVAQRPVVRKAGFDRASITGSQQEGAVACAYGAPGAI